MEPELKGPVPEAEPETTGEQYASDEEIMAISGELLERYAAVYEELAK